MPFRAGQNRMTHRPFFIIVHPRLQLQKFSSSSPHLVRTTESSSVNDRLAKHSLYTIMLSLVLASRSLATGISDTLNARSKATTPAGSKNKAKCTHEHCRALRPWSTTHSITRLNISATMRGDRDTARHTWNIML